MITADDRYMQSGSKVTVLVSFLDDYACAYTYCTLFFAS